MLLVAVLTVPRAKLDEFRAYEARAARIMARHGGEIERALVLPGAAESRPPSQLEREADALLAEAMAGASGVDELIAGSEVDHWDAMLETLRPTESAPARQPRQESLYREAPPVTGTVRELHVISFPDPEAYASYLADPELIALREVRSACVDWTEVWEALEGPRY